MICYPMVLKNNVENFEESTSRTCDSTGMCQECSGSGNTKMCTTRCDGKGSCATNPNQNTTGVKFTLIACGNNDACNRQNCAALKQLYPNGVSNTDVNLQYYTTCSTNNLFPAGTEPSSDEKEWITGISNTNLMIGGGVLFFIILLMIMK